ncbi:hypothetical protein [Hornefia butyriciproducens]|uniref:hypothetical protein n=1 Tax=Hornefia butyriciproducens TaxID=2652293 RepID=UPI003D01B42B|nr:hypothetical protein [Clostridiales bacterium]
MDKTEDGRITGFLINFSKLNDLYGITKVALYGGYNLDIEGLTKDDIEVRYHLLRERAIALGVLKEIKEYGTLR